MKKVLIIDDEEGICDVLKQGLERIGSFQVSFALDGKDGLAMAKDMKPDLIILDVHMPGIDGVEVLKRLKKHSNTMSIPVIMLTVVMDDSTQDECAKLYDEMYLEKPVDLNVLKEKVETIFRDSGNL